MNYLQTCSYNLDIAKIFDVKASAFLSCIDMEFSYQQRVGGLNDNNTVPLSRSEIYARTGLDDESQKDAELALQECGVISVKPLQNIPNKNYYILFKEQLTKILESDDPVTVIKSSNARQFVRSHRIEPVSKRKTYISNLKKKINVDDPIIQDYLCQWIDAVYVNPKGFLSPKSVEIAQEELFAYAKTQEIQIALLKIAIKGGLRDLSWAIEQYEKQNPIGTRNFASYNDIKADENVSNSEVF